MKIERYEGQEGSFELGLPDGWYAERDEEEGGLLVSAGEGEGLLHLILFDREGAEEADPAEELYAFLEDQEIELEEDEVEDVELEGDGSAALCEYIADDGEETDFWIVAVATAPGRLLFASYSCPAGKETGEREAVREIIEGIRFAAGAE